MGIIPREKLCWLEVGRRGGTAGRLERSCTGAQSRPLVTGGGGGGGNHGPWSLSCRGRGQGRAAGGPVVACSIVSPCAGSKKICNIGMPAGGSTVPSAKLGNGGLAVEV